MDTLLIAGAGKGIGLQLARQLATDHALITCARQATPEISALPVRFHALDVTRDPLDALTPEGPLRGLVYCPGSIRLKPFHRITPEEFLEDFTQNVIGAVRLISHLLPRLKEAQGASVVLFSSVAARTGMPFHASVAASKSAVEGLVKSLAAEYAGSGIRVNAIAPSLTDTPLAAGLLSTPEKREAAAKRHPLARVGNPAEMAALAAFLLSDHAAWITGQVIGADGGIGSLKS